MKENDADIATIRQFSTSFTHQSERKIVSFRGRNHPLYEKVLKLRHEHHGVVRAYLMKHKNHDDVIDSNSQHICLINTQNDALMGSIRVTKDSLEARTLFDENDNVNIPEGAVYEFSCLAIDPSAKRLAHGNLLMAAAAKYVKANDGDGILALCKRSNMKIFKRFGLHPIHESTLKTGEQLGELYVVYGSMNAIMQKARSRLGIRTTTSPGSPPISSSPLSQPVTVT